MLVQPATDRMQELRLKTKVYFQELFQNLSYTTEQLYFEVTLDFLHVALLTFKLVPVPVLLLTFNAAIGGVPAPAALLHLGVG